MPDGNAPLGILVLGLDRAGKTSLLKRLKNPAVAPSGGTPTLGVNVVPHQLGGLKLRIFDVGGQRSFREKWFTTVDAPDAVVYVHDLSEGREERVVESREWFVNMLLWFEDKGLGTPLLVLGNKVDLVESPSTRMLEEALDLNEFAHEPRRAFLTSAKTGEGIVEAFEWVVGVAREG
ncbi:MAG: ADP-ribosylation factor-like protein [Promethearchaeota archaeon]